MARPEFTVEEQYLINYMRSGRGDSPWNPYTLGYSLSATILAGFGIYTDSLAMLVWALLLVCGFRVYEDIHQSRGQRTWRSILDKYEAAIQSMDAIKPPASNSTDLSGKIAPTT